MCKQRILISFFVIKLRLCGILKVKVYKTFKWRTRMETIDWREVAFTFAGGFGLFLFGMEYMGEGLQKAAGNKMKNLLGVLTSNRLLGVLVGSGVTALIQSSSATTVMVVGVVNAGLMSLKQAVGVIMGANIGTTATAWIVALGEWTEFLKPSFLAPICIIIGVILMSFIKNTKTQQIGQILFGFGALFLGLDHMSSAAEPLQSLPQVSNLFITLGGNPILGILTGAVVTAVIQSSSASVGILQALAAAALVPWNSAIYIILGQNIGTCVTAILSSVGASRNAKRAATIHFLFNVIGSVIFGIIAYIIFGIVYPDAGKEMIDVTQISLMHTIYNVLNTLILFPFAGTLVFLAEKIIRGDEEELAGIHLDERILETPSFAIESVFDEVIRMGKIAEKNVRTAVEALFEKNHDKVEKVYERERRINELQKGINQYLIKLNNAALSVEENVTVTKLFHTVSDIERVGDHAENIVELATTMIDENLKFSEQAKEELIHITNICMECFSLAVDAYSSQNRELAKKVIPLEIKIDKLEDRSRSKHMRRLADNVCESGSGIIFLDAISNLERISDHASNIARLVLNRNKIFYEE